jgi:hypothetical protein
VVRDRFGEWLRRIIADAPFEGPFQALDYRWIDDGHPSPGVRMDEVPVHSVMPR